MGDNRSCWVLDKPKSSLSTCHTEPVVLDGSPKSG